MDNRKKIKIIILLVILLLSVLILIISTYLKNHRKTDGNVMENQEVDYYNEKRAQNGESAQDAVAALEDNNDAYYTVKSIIDNFNMYVGYLNANASDLHLVVSGNEATKILAEYKKDGIEQINYMVSNSYKKEMNTTDEDVYELLKDYANKAYVITDMYIVKDSDYISTYFVYGNYEGVNYNFVIILDRNNFTYEIYLNDFFEKKKYSKDNISTMKTLNVENVVNNGNNNFQYKNINKEEIASSYYNDYMYKLKNNIEDAYRLLDNKYKQSRFKNISEFNQYVQEITKNEDMNAFVGYSIVDCDGYTEYICNDNMGHIWVFKVTGTMKYTVLLDTYTVEVKSYSEEYANSSNEKRAQLCLNRFFEALNNKDYSSAYKFLNDQYKGNEFKTLDDFKSYVVENWPEHIEFIYTNMEFDGSNYLITGEISDMNEVGSFNASYIKKTIVLKLGSGIKDFQLSFNK